MDETFSILPFLRSIISGRKSLVRDVSARSLTCICVSCFFRSDSAKGPKSPRPAQLIRKSTFTPMSFTSLYNC